MKSRKNRIKRSGGTSVGIGYSEYEPKLRFSVSDLIDRGRQDSGAGADVIRILGGSKCKSRKSRKSRKGKKTKKGRGAYEGGKKKCPKHCRRKTRRTRKGLKHRKY